MTWSHLKNQPDTMIDASTMFQGGEVFRGEAVNSEATLKKVLAGREVVIDGMAKLVELYENHQPIYVRINHGPRAGSIARLMRNQIRLNGFHGVSSYEQVVQQGTVTTKPSLFVYIRKTTYGTRYDMVITMLKWLELNMADAAALEFDGRKPIKLNYSEMTQLEFLPDYTGETVYAFARAPSKTAEQKAAEKKSKDFSHTPIDMFGHEVAPGDMIIYARVGELVIGRLKKVSPKGHMTVETVMDKKELRLQGSESSDCIVKGKKNPALMKFNKDEVLSQKLMLEKLRK